MWQRIEFHFKKSNRKTDQKCPKLLHKKPKLQTYLKGGKIAGRAPKKPAKLNNLIVYSDKGQLLLE